MAHGFMKRIQSPYFATGNPETEEMTTLYAPGMLGCVADFDQGGISGPQNICSYQLVLQDAVQVVVGNVLMWSTKTAAKVTTSVANRGQLAGIARIAAAALSTYIWILKRGDRNVLFVDAPTSAPDATGKPVVVSGTTGKADALANAQAQAAFPLIGTTLGAQDGGTKQASVRVNIPDVY